MTPLHRASIEGDLEKDKTNIPFIEKPLQYNAVLSGAVSGNHSALALWAISCGATDFQHARWQAKWYQRVLSKNKIHFEVLET